MLITVSGAIGAGKDAFTEELVDYLEQQQTKPVKLVKFADPLRNVAFALGFNPDDRQTKEFIHVRSFTATQLSDEVFKAFPYIEPFTRRIIAAQIHQTILKDHSLMGPGGYRVPNISCRQFMVLLGMKVRDFVPDYFIQHLKKAHEGFNGYAIASDCRFPNELAASDYHIHIERPNNPYAVASSDLSEAHGAILKKEANYVVVNDETLRELSNEAYIMAATLQGRKY